MYSDPLYDTIQATFVELGAEADAPIQHTFLLRDRRFVGHCFRCGNMHAIWKPGGSEVEFFGPQGHALRVVNLSDRKGRDAA